MNKLKILLTFAVMTVIIGFFLYWIGNKANQQKENRIEKVENGFKYSRGIITEVHSYKGHSIGISYNINGVNYQYSGGWDNNPKKLNVGDSISFKYSISEPKLIVTELERNY